MGSGQLDNICSSSKVWPAVVRPRDYIAIAHRRPQLYHCRREDLLNLRKLCPRD